MRHVKRLVGVVFAILLLPWFVLGVCAQLGLEEIDRVFLGAAHAG